MVRRSLKGSLCSSTRLQLPSTSQDGTSHTPTPQIRKSSSPRRRACSSVDHRSTKSSRENTERTRRWPHKSPRRSSRIRLVSVVTPEDRSKVHTRKHQRLRTFQPHKARRLKALSSNRRSRRRRQCSLTFHIAHLGKQPKPHFALKPKHRNRKLLVYQPASRSHS